jgi:phosphoglycerate dehydrogenase-like enzyme
MTEIPQGSSPQNSHGTRKIPAAFLSGTDCVSIISQIFDEARRQRLAQSAELLPAILTPKNFDEHREAAAQVEVLFATWGIPGELLTQTHFPSLRAVFYAAGSIKGFGRPVLERGIQVTTAKSANAITVAQYCVGQIILSCKDYFRNLRSYRAPSLWEPRSLLLGPGVYGGTIALLGMGAVARELVLMLRLFQLQVIAVDPYLSQADATKLGVKIVTMEEAFAQAYVVSNHLPDLPTLQGVLDRRLFASMSPNATFMNTGRGGQINEKDLIDIATTRPDLTMLLDVTDPEPAVADSPLFTLPNIYLTSHIAGAWNQDLHRFGDTMIEEFERYCAGQPLRFAESLDAYDRSA